MATLFFFSHRLFRLLNQMMVAAMTHSSHWVGPWLQDTPGFDMFRTHLGMG